MQKGAGTKAILFCKEMYEDKLEVVFPEQNAIRLRVGSGKVSEGGSVLKRESMKITSG